MPGKRVKATKTEESREIPIEPNSLRLLARMRKRAKGRGLVAPLLSEVNEDDVARITREQFEKAKCEWTRL